MHTSHTWRYVDLDDEFGWRPTVERGVLVVFVVIFVVLAGWQVLQPITAWYGEIGAALDAASGG